MTKPVISMLIVMSCFLLYGHTLDYGITWLDDYYWLVLDKDFLSNASNWLTLFSKDVFLFPDGGEFYRPLLSSTFILDSLLNSNSFFYSHLINLLLHSLASLLFFIFLNNLFHAEYASALATLVFASHPASATVVSWIPGRNESLLAVSVFLALISILRFRDSGKVSNLFFFGFFLLCTLLSKENAIVLPFLAAAILFYDKRHRNLKTVSLFALASAVPAALWLILRCSAPVHSDLNFLLTIRNFVYAPLLAGRALFPFDSVPASPYSSLLHGWLYLTVFCVFSALCLYGILSEKVSEGKFNIAFGLMMSVLFLLPTFAVSGDGSSRSFFSEHRLYLPLAGLIVSLLQIVLLNRRQSFSAALSCIFLLFLCSVSVCHSFFYKNNYVFWQEVVRNYGNYPKYIRHLAWQEQHRYVYGSAIYYYKKALELNPDDYESQAGLIGIYSGNNYNSFDMEEK